MQVLIPIGFICNNYAKNCGIRYTWEWNMETVNIMSKGAVRVFGILIQHTLAPFSQCNNEKLLIDLF